MSQFALDQQEREYVQNVWKVGVFPAILRKCFDQVRERSVNELVLCRDPEKITTLQQQIVVVEALWNSIEEAAGVAEKVDAPPARPPFPKAV